MFFKLLTDGLKVVSGAVEATIAGKAKLAISVSPALLGVGFILGIRVAAVMVGGAALSALVIIPLIDWWGQRFQNKYPVNTLRLLQADWMPVVK
jgi:uncharacterized oligopeptide transporter (OPT) family protein